jgi:hypothetical protein
MRICCLSSVWSWKTLLLLSMVCLTGCATKQYVGVVRRASDGQPVSDISVAATATPIPRSNLMLYPRQEINAGVTRSGADGTFAFVLPYSSHRLTFSALGLPIDRVIVSSGVTVRGCCGNVIVRHPSPDRLMVITIPDAFRPYHPDVTR